KLVDQKILDVIERVVALIEGAEVEVPGLLILGVEQDGAGGGEVMTYSIFGNCKAAGFRFGPTFGAVFAASFELTLGCFLSHLVLSSVVLSHDLFHWEDSLGVVELSSRWWGGSFRLLGLAKH